MGSHRSSSGGPKFESPASRTLPASTSRPSPPTNPRPGRRFRPASGTGTGRSARHRGGAAIRRTPRRIRSGRSDRDRRQAAVVRIPLQPALREHERPIGRRQRPQEPPDHFLRVAQPVHRCGVDPVDAEIDRPPHRGDRLVVVLRPPAVGPSAATGRPRAETHHRDVDAAAAQGATRKSRVGHAMSSLRFALPACCLPLPRSRFSLQTAALSHAWSSNGARDGSRRYEMSDAWVTSVFTSAISPLALCHSAFLPSAICHPGCAFITVLPLRQPRHIPALVLTKPRRRPGRGIIRIRAGFDVAGIATWQRGSLSPHLAAPAARSSRQTPRAARDQPPMASARPAGPDRKDASG